MSPLSPARASSEQPKPVWRGARVRPRRGPQQGCPGGRRAMVKKVGKYEIGRTLGEGTFGKVKYAVNSETAERVAIKILDKVQLPLPLP